MAGKVKVIYIDPPYNTGNDDFIYKDDFDRHSTWLTMMEERLLLARDLLTDDGVIFVSIDDNEQSRLKELMDLVFGTENFIANVVWEKKYTRSNDASGFSCNHEYVQVHARDVERFQVGLLGRNEKQLAAYRNPDNDPRDVWKSTPLHAKSGTASGFTHTFKNGVVWSPPTGTYPRYAVAELDRMYDENRIWFGVSGNAVPSRKSFLNEVKEGVNPVTIWTEDELDIDAEEGEEASSPTLWHHEQAGHTDMANRELRAVVGAGLFENPKPPALVKYILNLTIAKNKAGLALDFFAGSGTTGHAVINLNREDGGQRKFVLVEQGNHFESVLLPRIQKVMYSPVWKDGQPQPGGMLPQPEWVALSPRLVKVLRLESYEDSLNALVTPASGEGQLELPADPDLLRYLLPPDEAARDQEAALAGGEPSVRPTVLLNPAALERPFDYRLPTGEPPGKSVDLVTSFNLLRGLHVRRQYDVQAGGRRYLLVDALEAAAPVLVVWRDLHKPPYDALTERADFAAALTAAGLDVTAYTTVYHNADMVPEVARDTTIRLQSVDDLFQQAIDPAARLSNEEQS